MNARKIKKEFQGMKINYGEEKLNEGSISNATQVNEVTNDQSWYRKLIQNSGTRIQRLERYDYMDQTTTKISRALDIIADEVSSQNVDVPDPFVIDYEDTKKVRQKETNLVRKNQI